MKTKIILFALFAFIAFLGKSQTFSIPNDAAVIKDSTSTNIEYNYWVCSEGELYADLGGINVFMEEGSKCLSWHLGGSNYYVKNNATLYLWGEGGSNTIYYEPDAIIFDSLYGGGSNVFIECADLIFDYYFAPKDGCNENTLDIDENIGYFSVSPNPTTGIINIRLKDEDVGNYVLRIFDNIGKEIFKSNTSTQIDLKEYGSGYYFLIVCDNKGRINKIKLLVL